MRDTEIELKKLQTITLQSQSFTRRWYMSSVQLHKPTKPCRNSCYEITVNVKLLVII